MSRQLTGITHIIVMGVSGCGKTTAAMNLHNALGRPVAEADDFHPQANIDKMSVGVPLTDEDRWPWLESLCQWMDQRFEAGEQTIVTCSALKRIYRNLLSKAKGRVVFVHLKAAQESIRDRMEQREGHFMPPTLLPSQFATLEELDPDEDGVVVESADTPEETFAAIMAALNDLGAASPAESAQAAPAASAAPAN